MTDRIPPAPRLKRAYEPPAGSDGTRVLVERLWPRGLRKAVARIDLWLKDIAPSPELRTWYGHDPAKWPEFQRRYTKELRNNPQAVQRLCEMLEKGTVTLVFAARDERRNSALVLREFMESGGDRD